MNIINLRSVGDFEISDSFEGILRISPNLVTVTTPSGDETSVEDNPVHWLKERNKNIPLSDSGGNMLPLTFKPKWATVILSKGGNTIAAEPLTHISHVYNKLYITNSLNIKSTLFIDRKADSGVKRNQSPLLFIKDGNITAFPLESPDYADFINYNDKYNIAGHENWQDSLFRALGPNNPCFTQENHPEQVLVDGKPIYRHILYTSDGIVYKIPEINRRTYALGVCPGHTFDLGKEDTVFDTSHAKIFGTEGKRYTQLSYVNVENIVWKNVEATSTGVVRNYNGRYYNLHPYGTGDDEDGKNSLGKTLFKGIDATIQEKAPITGVGVQPLTIHYNAIPARRYFFHLERRRKARGISVSRSVTSANLSIKGVMNNITMEYALCDGKTIYNENTKYSAYPIDINAYKLNLTGLHKKLLSSGPIMSPPLFEIDQLNLRYLRGLNWLRNNYNGNTPISTTTKHNFSNNTKVYKYPGVTSHSDLSNHIKDVNQVGMHYANYDNTTSRKWKHAHFVFAKPNSENPEVPSANSTEQAPDTLKHIVNEAATPNKAEWTNYRSNFKSSFGNRYMMRTLGYKNDAILDNNGNPDNDKLRIMQDCPVSSMGGDNRYYHYALSCYKFGKRKVGVCMNHRVRCGTGFYMRDAKYSLASCVDSDSVFWRFTSSLPIQNKYGAKGSVITTPVYSSVKYESVSLNLDDSLPSPPSINFIPLIKI